MVVKVKVVTPKEAFELCKEGALLLDIRDEFINAFKQFDVELVINIPLKKLNDKINNLPKGQLIIIADTSGINSKEVFNNLFKKGFNVCVLAGGFVEWERDGFPILINKKERLSGSCACQLRPREKK